MKLKVFADAKVLGELEINEATRAAIVTEFIARKPFVFNVRPEQKAPITFLQRKPDAEERYHAALLPDYGVRILGNPADIYYLLRKGKI